jgi:hypothetical protein
MISLEQVLNIPREALALNFADLREGRVSLICPPPTKQHVHFPLFLNFGASGSDSPILKDLLGREISKLVFEYGSYTTRLVPYGNIYTPPAEKLELATLSLDCAYKIQSACVQTGQSNNCFIRLLPADLQETGHDKIVSAGIIIPGFVPFSIEVEGAYSPMLMTLSLVATN